MQKSPSEIARRILKHCRVEGYQPSPLPGVHFVRYTATDKRTKRHWRACLAFVIQGCKEIVFGRDLHRCVEGYYTVAPIQLPVMSRIAAATPEMPFIAVLIDLDPRVLADVAAQITERATAPAVQAPTRALFSGTSDEKMFEALKRLVKLLDTPEEGKVLGPLIIRELFYYVLKGPEGAAIHQFVTSGSKVQRILKAMQVLTSDLDQPIDIEALARTAHMSRSAFFKHFNDVTAMSPIQYQKRLRLLEAKRLMTHDGASAEQAAFAVGYNSASQFSREYSRMFGQPPARDTKRR